MNNDNDKDLMINDIVPYSFGHKLSYGKIVGIRIVTDIVSGKRTGVFTTRSYTIQDTTPNMFDAVHGEMQAENFEKAGKKRLEQIRKEIQVESISWGEIAEVESLKRYIEPDDVELRQWAGIKEGDANKSS